MDINFRKSKPKPKTMGNRKKKEGSPPERERVEAPLLHPEDFPTDEKEALKDYGLEVEKMKIDEQKKGFGFRSMRKKGGGGGRPRK